MKGHTLLLLAVVAKYALAFTVTCGDADLSKLTSLVYVSPQGNDSSSCGQKRWFTLQEYSARNYQLSW